MNIKYQIDISKIILQIISMLVPLVGIILSQFKGTERRMDQKKEKWNEYLIIYLGLYL